MKNSQITVDQVITFLNKKPGYLKKGAKYIANTVFSGAISVNTARLALQRANKYKSTGVLNTDKKQRVLIYDIETSYNIVSAWRIGHNITLNHNNIIKERQIICVSYKWLDEDKVYSLHWGRYQDDKELLERFIPVLNEADVIVAHNGDKFDIKWIQTRALKHGLKMLPYYNQVDTLKIAKKKFYFNSNKLDYISKFLGFEGKIVNEPGLWDKVILQNDLDALKKMIVYCDEDVIQLEKVYKALSTWDKPKQHAGALLFDNPASSSVSGSTDIEHVKTTTTPGGTKKHIMRDIQMDTYFEMSDSLYKKYLKNKEDE